jgi:hypothetical protein
VLADSVRTIADVARNYTPDLQAMIEGRGKLGEAARRMGQARDATVHALPVESRAAGVWTLFSTLTRAIYDDYFDIGKSQYSADETKTAAAKLHTRLADAEAHILQHGDDDQWIRRYEQSALRPLALEAQMHMRRNHLTVARPVWPSSPRFPQTSRVFYSGGQAVLGLLEAACLRTGLVLQRPSLAVSHASARWETLRSSHIAVFDFTGYSPVDFTTAGSVAAVAYELGMALAVGCPVVAIATEKQSTPFDLDIAPVRLPRSLEDTGGLSAALERAVYGIQRRECGNSLRATRTFLRQRIDGRDNAAVHEALRLMDESVDHDAVRLLRLAESVVGAEDSQFEVLFPALPGVSGRQSPPSVPRDAIRARLGRPDDGIGVRRVCAIDAAGHIRARRSCPRAGHRPFNLERSLLSHAHRRGSPQDSIRTSRWSSGSLTPSAGMCCSSPRMNPRSRPFRT